MKEITDGAFEGQERVTFTMSVWKETCQIEIKQKYSTFRFLKHNYTCLFMNLIGQQMPVRAQG